MRSGVLRWSALVGITVLLSQCGCGGKARRDSSGNARVDGSVGAAEGLRGPMRSHVELLWKSTLPAKGDIPYSCGLLVCKDELVMVDGWGSGIYAFNRASGKLRWRTPAPGGGLYLPAANSQLAFVGCQVDALLAIDLGAGTLRWHYETQGQPRWVLTTKDAVYCASVKSHSERHLYALEAGSGKLTWQQTFYGEWLTTVPSHGILLSADVVRGAGVIGYSMATGEEAFSLPCESSVSTSIATDGDGAFFGDEAGQLHAVDLSGRKTRWVVPMGGRSLVGAVSAEHGVVTCAVVGPGGQRGEISWLAGVRESDGRMIWRHPLPEDDADSRVESCVRLGEMVLFDSGDYPLQTAAQRDSYTAIWKLPSSSAEQQAMYDRWREATGRTKPRPFVLTALDTNTGEVLWTFPLEDELGGPPVESNGVFYCADEKGNVYAIK
jgi:outer membrane protein assembly factor BamB